MPSNPFSSSLNLIDLNDYLGPSQTCIKPISSASVGGNPQDTSKSQIELDRLTGDYYEIHPSSSSKLKEAEITLNDCLACSGCITSAESVLVSLQSVDEVLKAIKKPNRYPIVSISSHSLASFAAYNNLSTLSQAFRAFQNYFTHKLHFKLVLDLSFSQRLHLWESRNEFKQHQNSHNNSHLSKRSTLLASSCPGWVCYAEKTQGKNGILEMISQVRSAQQIQGALVKSHKLASTLGICPTEIYHVCVMSCYDKKLEASRPDFQTNHLKEVDCVLTTREVQDLMVQDGFDILQAAQVLEPSTVSSPADLPIWVDHPEPKGSSTGGYLFNILRSVVSDVPQNDRNRLKLVIDRKRGSDHTEYRLQLDPQNPCDSSSSPSTLFQGAHFYGFKNLQNLIRKLGPTNAHTQANRARRSKRPTATDSKDLSERGYDYVEVMACPSGCVNGGGQISAPKSMTLESSYSAKEWVGEVEKKYFGLAQAAEKDQLGMCLEIDRFEEEEVSFIQEWLKRWGLDKDGEMKRKLFQTSYQAVEAEPNGFTVQW
ncbi:hypothetical protein O181_034155 [Austropuccinia psidii MF-1]|uniref:Iron hydrogenase large subunit C-terminal domain-containing protein n=1 Tax=Austropuccinia psidii MF-1 TaxID=1389203 RepID=A0A9Q3H9X0_9BASI|nr:hypothetical protein [Austropuccinia psidii MF-1]